MSGDRAENKGILAPANRRALEEAIARVVTDRDYRARICWVCMKDCGSVEGFDAHREEVHSGEEGEG